MNYNKFIDGGIMNGWSEKGVKERECLENRLTSPTARRRDFLICERGMGRGGARGDGESERSKNKRMCE